MFAFPLSDPQEGPPAQKSRALSQKSVERLQHHVSDSKKFHCVPIRIYCPMEVKLDLLDLDVRFINFPEIIAYLPVRATTLLQRWCIGLNPTVDRGMIDMQPHATPAPA